MGLFGRRKQKMDGLQVAILRPSGAVAVLYPGEAVPLVYPRELGLAIHREVARNMDVCDQPAPFAHDDYPMDRIATIPEA